MARQFNAGALALTLLALLVMVLPTWQQFQAGEEETVVVDVPWYSIALPASFNVFPPLALVLAGLAIIALVVGLIRHEISVFSLSVLASATVSPVIGHLIFDGLHGWGKVAPILTGLAVVSLGVGFTLADRLAGTAQTVGARA